MIIYPNSKAQHIVEVIFFITVFPLVSMIEFDRIDVNYGFVYIGVLLGLTVLNTILANIAERWR